MRSDKEFWIGYWNKSLEWWYKEADRLGEKLERQMSLPEERQDWKYIRFLNQGILDSHSMIHQINGWIKELEEA